MSTTEMEAKLAQLQEWEQIIAEATAEAKSIREEITDVMLQRDVEELICGRFICRYTSILSSRFDTKRFKGAFGEEVYKSFTREVPSCRFTVNAALKTYREMALDRYGITVSENALKNKSPMYIDTETGAKQVGYVITGKTDFDRGDHFGYSSQFIDLWITIQTIVETVF